MTIYDELGLPPDATEEQIRQAHRHLVKVLHPDLQQDAELRRMAELQLIRVNRMVEQLLQASGRGQALVVAGPARAAENPTTGSHRAARPVETVKPVNRWKMSAMLLGGVAVLALLALLLPEPAIRSQAGSPVPVVAAKPVVRTEAPVAAAGNSILPRTRQLMSPRNAVATTLGNSVPSEPSPASAAVPAAPSVSYEAAPIAPVHSGNAAVPPAASAVVRDESSEATKSVETGPELDGIWLYAGDPGPGGNAKLYPPEYIELRLARDSDGTLRGEYRSRYAVSDVAISPSVNFRFREKNPNLSAVSWVGPRGSAGTVSLNLVRANVLEVIWKATAVASNNPGGAELTYGAATLIRRR